MQNAYVASFSTLILLSLVLTLPSVYADTWYVGKGLKQGDFFKYDVCYADYHNCIPLEIDFWVQNQTDDGNWNLQLHTLDGNISQTGMITFGANFTDPINYSPNLANYANTFKNTITWLHFFATNESPKDFSNPVWNRGSGQPLGPTGQQEQVTVKAGTFDTWIIGWHKGVDNKIWVVPNMPFPVKALTWIDCACGRPPPLFSFEMLETGNSTTEPTWNMSQTSSSMIPTPLKQFKSGVSMINMKCKHGFDLMVKAEDLSPACVKSDDSHFLIERGWAISVVSKSFQNMTQSISCKDPNSKTIYELSTYYKVKPIVLAYTPIQKIIDDSSYCEILALSDIYYGNGTTHYTLAIDLNNTKELSAEVSLQTNSVVSYRLDNLVHTHPAS